jgi:membrane-associated phospholipid phosphatase
MSDQHNHSELGHLTRRLARLISRWLNPQLYSPLVFLVSALAVSSSPLDAALYTLVPLLLLVLPVYAVTYLGLRRGHYRHQWVPERERRQGIYLFGVTAAALCLAALYGLGAPREVLATLLAVTLSGFTGMLINRTWKISIHTGGIAGSVTVFSFFFWPYAILTWPLVPLVAWARVVLGEHTVGQVLAGGALASGITALCFLLVA